MTHAMAYSSDIAFNVGDQGMDPGQHFHRNFPRTENHPIMPTGRAIQYAIALPAFGANHHLWRQTILDQGMDLFSTDPGDHPQGRKAGPLFQGFHGHHHFRLASRTAATFPGFGNSKVRCRPSLSNQPICKRHPDGSWLCEFCGPWSIRFDSCGCPTFAAETVWKCHFSAAQSTRSSKTAWSKGFWSCETRCRPSAKLESHRT
jgi:hypothetical protein